MTKKQPAEIPFAARNISELDPNFLVDLRTACCILTRSRAHSIATSPPAILNW